MISQQVQTGNGWPAGVASPISDAARPFQPMGTEIGMDWKEQYRHPNWQRKRLEALEAADYVCQRCFDGEAHLHVHHRHYFKGRKVWEYSLRELEVLCESCHLETHAELAVLGTLLAQIPSDAMSEVIALVAGFCSEATGPIREVDPSGPIHFVGTDFFMVKIGRIAGMIQAKNLDCLDHILSSIESSEPGPWRPD